MVATAQALESAQARQEFPVMVVEGEDVTNTNGNKRKIEGEPPEVTLLRTYEAETTSSWRPIRFNSRCFGVIRTHSFHCNVKLEQGLTPSLEVFNMPNTVTTFINGNIVSERSFSLDPGDVLSFGTDDYMFIQELNEKGQLEHILVPLPNILRYFDVRPYTEEEHPKEIHYEINQSAIPIGEKSTRDVAILIGRITRSTPFTNTMELTLRLVDIQLKRREMYDILHAHEKQFEDSALWDRYTFLIEALQTAQSTLNRATKQADIKPPSTKRQKPES